MAHPSLPSRSFLKINLIIALLVLGGIFVFPKATEAATLFFTPDSGNRIVGRSFTVNVGVGSADTSMNAFSGVVSFPTDKLEVVSLSKTKSVVNFWSEEPSYSNREGRISFEGIVLNPGYQGTDGNIISVTFRTKSEGKAALSFLSGSVLANDGEGTNILKSLGNASFVIERAPSGEAPPAPAPTVVVAPGGDALPDKPVVRTNPPLGPDGWYNGDAVEFAWNLPPGVDSVSHAISQDANFSLPKEDKGLMPAATYDFRDLGNGSWYFFVRFHNKTGWGSFERVAFRIDRTPPAEFSIRRLDPEDTTNPQPVFEWGTEDRDSGIDRYDIKIGSGDWFGVEVSTYNRYILPPQLPTNNGWIFIRAHDRAGNIRKAMLEFVVRPIETPVVNEYSKSVTTPSEPFMARGEALPNTKIILFLKRGSETVSFETQSNNRGAWSTEYRGPLKSGTWQFTAQANDFRGAWSEETVPVDVKARSSWRDIARLIGEWGLILIALIAILGGIVGIGYFTVYRVMAWRAQLKHELEKMRRDMHQDLTALESEIGRHPERRVELLRKEMEKIDAGLEHETKHLDSFGKNNDSPGSGQPTKS